MRRPMQTCIIILALLSPLITAAVRPNRVRGAYDLISFPAEISSSPFLQPEELSSSNKLQERFKHAVRGLFEIVMRLRKVIDEVGGGMGSKNFVVSPLSIAAALGQLLLGAGGDTRRRLAQLLTPLSDGRLDENFHRELGSLIRYLQDDLPESANYTLDVAGAFFVLKDMPMTESFRFAVNHLYGGEFVRLNFSTDPKGSQDYVNSWVSKHTRGHITSILPYPLPLTTTALLANTIYFSGAWQTQFDPEDSIESHFRVSSTQKVPITLMRNSFEMLYANSTEFHMVALPYRNEEAALFILLTHNDSKPINDVMADLSLEELHRVIRTMGNRTVNFAMPKMTISATFSLREPLAKLQQLAKQNENRPGIQLNIFDPETLDENVSKPPVVPDNPENTTKEEPTKEITETTDRNKLPQEPGRTDDISYSSNITNNQTVESTTDAKHTESTKRPTSTTTTTTAPPTTTTTTPHTTTTTEVAHTTLISKSNKTAEVKISNSSKTNQIEKNSTEETTSESRQSLRHSRQIHNTNPSNAPNIRNKQNHERVSNGHRSSSTTSHPASVSTGKESDRTGSQHKPLSTPQQHTPDNHAPNDATLDMSGASDDSRFRIDDIIHQAWIEISERGTEATAVTASSVDYSLDVVNFKVNRPFLFFIRHEQTLAPLFWGAIADPTSGSEKSLSKIRK